MLGREFARRGAKLISRAKQQRQKWGEFMTAWQTSSNLAEMAFRLNMSCGHLKSWASYFRHHGVKLTRPPTYEHSS
jgi:hypothetical protein